MEADDTARVGQEILWLVQGLRYQLFPEPEYDSYWDRLERKVRVQNQVLDEAGEKIVGLIVQLTEARRPKGQ